MAEENIQIVKNISQVLAERSLVRPEDLKRAAEIAEKEGAFLEDALFALDVMSDIELTKVIGEVYSLPYIDLSQKKIPFIVLSKFPEEIARKYNMVVFEMVGDQMVKVALAKPWDPITRKALEFIRTKNSINIDPYIVTQTGLQEVLKQYNNPIMVEKETGSAVVQEGVAKEKIETEKTSTPETAGVAREESPAEPVVAKTPEKKEEASPIADLVKEDVETKEQLQEIIDNSAIPRIVAAIIKFGFLRKASDIHVEPMEKADTVVRYRIDGVLNKTVTIPAKDHAALVSRIKILSKLKIDEQRVPQDGRIDVSFGGKEIDLRISTFPTIIGEKVVMRILDKSGGILQVEDLGMAGRTLKLFVEAISIPFGILLVTGPTGSGKSTTLYAAMSRINKEGVNIVTLEDPVEYQIRGVNQSQVKPYIGYTFGSGLRSILRQDPNIIMVGEIRDKETAEMAVQSALTGHLVLSTLHTNDSAGAIPRLIDMGVEPFLISSSLHTVVAQRLVRRICSECKKEVDVPEAVWEDMKEEFGRIPDEYKQGVQIDVNKRKVFEGAGCPKCGGTGYKGRQAIFELLKVSDEIKSMIIKRASSADIMNQALKEGMITMKQDGILKVLQGVTTMEEVYRVISI